MIVSIIAIILNSNYVYAHPLLIESDPANLERLSSAPSRVVIVFSEPVEARFSWIRVYDSSNNRVDNNDTNYVDNNPTKLGVTLRPLDDGLYTVNTRVLSQVDGHIVDYTFIFMVGDATLSNASNNSISNNAISSEQIILPDAVAKFPAYIAQVMVVGLAVVTLYLWKPLHTLLRIPYISISRVYKVTIIAGVMLIASSIALAVIQSISLNTSVDQVLTSKFGSMLLLRLVGGVSLLVLAYAIARRKNNNKKKDRYEGREEGKEVEKDNLTVKRLSIALLIIGSSVIVSITLVSHSAAVSIESTVVDLIHNILASIWIGGVITLAFVVMPSIKQAVKDSMIRGYALSLTIPRFSQLALLSIGILGITGPLVLWGIESDIVRLLKTEYGLMLSIKLALAALMVILGGYSTFKVHKRVISILNINTGKGYAYQDNSIDGLYSYANSLLKLEAYVGIALLLSVALLTNTVPPEAYTLSKLSTASIGEGSIGGVSYRSVNLISTVGDSNVELTIKPARLGINSVYVVVKDSDGNELKDLKSVKLKVRPNITDIGPVTYELVKDNNINAWFSSNVALTSNGLWRFEVNAERESALNISVSFDVMIKPDLSEMRFDVKEYQLPYRDSIPFYILYSKEDNAIWVSDGNRASVWMLDLASEQFKEYRFDGTISTILARDSHGRIWFLDPASKAFGYIDPSKYNNSSDARIFSVPYGALAVYIYIDSNNRIWLSLVDKGSVIMYNSIEDVERGVYKEFKLPQGFVPTYITGDTFNNIWFTATTNEYGVIGMIDTRIDSSKDGKEAVRLLDHRLSEPLAMHISSNGSIWVSEHIGSPARITYIDPLLGIINSYSVIDNNALPYGIIQDKLGNVWFAQHTVDKIGVLDSYRGKMREVNTLSKGSFVQWITVDDDGKVWYAASRAASIGVIKWSAIEVSGQEQLTTTAIRNNNNNNNNSSSNNVTTVMESPSKRYVEIFAPSLALLITSVSLIYLRSSREYNKALKIIKNV